MRPGVSGKVGKREIVRRGREKRSWRAGRTTLAAGLVVLSEGAGDGSGRVCATFRFLLGWLFGALGVDGRDDDSESDGILKQGVIMC